MEKRGGLYIFGEVLFDRFPDSQSVLGGAPFNVAWHLQALGDKPLLISRVGEDELGEMVLKAMRDWGMGVSMMQTDAIHPTGQVTVRFRDNEPNYEIVNNCAYDFISAEQLPEDIEAGILYHGSLGLRNSVSCSAYEKLVSLGKLKVYLDVNLRPPWWDKDLVMDTIGKATWVKLNLDELEILAGDKGDLEEKITRLQTRYELQQIIVTRGEEGALIRTEAGEWVSSPPERAARVVDTVGAGDAFSAMYLHGLLAGWEVMENLRRSQRFASKVVEIRGATTRERSLYKDF